MDDSFELFVHELMSDDGDADDASCKPAEEIACNFEDAMGGVSEEPEACRSEDAVGEIVFDVHTECGADNAGVERQDVQCSSTEEEAEDEAEDKDFQVVEEDGADRGGGTDGVADAVAEESLVESLDGGLLDAEDVFFQDGGDVGVPESKGDDATEEEEEVVSEDLAVFSESLFLIVEEEIFFFFAFDTVVDEGDHRDRREGDHGEADIVFEDPEAEDDGDARVEESEEEELPGFAFCVFGADEVFEHHLFSLTTRGGGNLLKPSLGEEGVMALEQSWSRRKASGGRFRPWRKKKLYALGNNPTLTKLGVEKRKTVRILGGGVKTRLLDAQVVNVLDPKSRKCFLVKVETVVDNPANRNFIRRNILTRGAVVKTEKGEARITSRPGQEGTLNAVLIKK